MHHSLSSLAMESSMHGGPARATEADEFVDAVSQELLCVICGSVLIDPRVLRCQHCFCLRCLFATVMHDRGSHVTVHCAYRCPEVTVTDGDIRTLSRNTLITNLAHLVRDRTRRKFLQQASASSQMRHERGPAGSRQQSSVLTSSASIADATAASGAAGTGARPARTATTEDVECEWCGASTGPVTWCAHCLSQVCERCNGVFEDHSFLCTELHVPAKPSKPRAIETDTAGDADVDDAHEAEAVHGVPPEERFRGPLPFLFPACALDRLLSDAVRAAQSPVQREREPLKVTVESARPVRLSCQLQEVRYTHEVFGTLCTYGVIPDGLTPFGKTVVTPAEVQWGAVERGTTSLLFASNVIELTGQFVQHLAQAHAEVELARFELKSAARRAFVRHNIGFQAVVLHLTSQFRNVVKIVQNCVIPCLERGRAIEGLMGDVVISQFYQQWSQGSPMERKTVQDRVANFLQTEIKLCGNMDDMIEKLSRQCELGVALVESTLREVSSCMQESVRAQDEYTRIAAKCDHAQKRLSHGLPIDSVRPSDQARTAGSDPIFNTYADRTFSGQWREKEAPIATVRNALVGVLLHLSKLRHWVWDYTNTSVRDCGVSPADQTMLIEKEEVMQTLMDTTLQMCAAHTARTYAWEVLFVHLETCSVPISQDIVSTVCLFEMSNLRALYSCENTLSLFSRLRELREYLFQQSGNPLYVIQSRTFQRQEEIIEVMKTVISECMEEQSTSIQLIVSCEENAGAALDAMLAEHVVPATEACLPERDLGGRTDLDVLRDLLAFSAADMDQLSAQLPTPHRAIAADHYVRELALHRSSTFGTFLIDLAHGRVQAGTAEADPAAADVAAASPSTEPSTEEAPAAAAREASPAAVVSARVTPFLRSVPLTPAVLGGSTAPLNARDDPLQLPTGAVTASTEEHARQTRRLVSTSSFSSLESVEPQETPELRAVESTVAAAVPGMDPAAMVNETLFAASDAPTSVARVALTPKASDPQGYEKAVRIFARHYHFSTVETRTTAVIPLQLPFFEGSVRVTDTSGEDCYYRFLVDAQTGQTYVHKDDTVSKRKSLTTLILMSPFFIFAIFNLTLHPFLQVKSTHVGWT